MSDSQKHLDLAARSGASGGEAARARILAQPRGTGRHAGIRGPAAARISAPGHRLERRRRIPVEGRRNFLKLMGASLALAGLTACTRQPTEHIMPYVRQPEELIPGRPLFFRHGDHAGRRGQRRPGGEPRRPAHQDGRQSRASRHAGRLRRFSQAAVLQLYDPDRAQASLSTAKSAAGRFLRRFRGCWRRRRPRTARASASSPRP
jgi:hypothetical protein